MYPIEQLQSQDWCSSGIINVNLESTSETKLEVFHCGKPANPPFSIWRSSPFNSTNKKGVHSQGSQKSGSGKSCTLRGNPVAAVRICYRMFCFAFLAPGRRRSGITAPPGRSMELRKSLASAIGREGRGENPRGPLKSWKPAGNSTGSSPNTHQNQGFTEFPVVGSWDERKPQGVVYRSHSSIP